MPKLTETRRKMRLISLMDASDMIENYHKTGVTPEEMNMTQHEFKIWCEENERTAKILMNFAKNLYKDGDFNNEKNYQKD